MKVFEAVTEAVAAEGLDHLFAVMGDANLDIIVNLGMKRAPSVWPMALRDSAARPASPQSPKGPGYTNATTSLIAARLHRTPLLLLAGHASLRDPYNPQGMVDQQALAMLTTKAGIKLDSPKIVDYCLGEAFRQLRAKTGPFILNLPQDIQQSDMPDAGWDYKPVYREDRLQPARSKDPK